MDLKNNIDNDKIIQVDGNDSVASTIDDTKLDKISAALSLPRIATYNLRSFLPKAGNTVTDILERNIDCALLQEIWEVTENKNHQNQIEEMLEIDGLRYFSSARQANCKGKSYGGVAIIVNMEKFSAEKLSVPVPKNVEAIWCLLKPKTPTCKFKNIIACSFYSPPDKRKNSKMADHLVSTLHMLYAKFPDSGLILGADRNAMDIKPVLNCGLRLRQVVDKPTRGDKILDIIIMNLSSYYNTPYIAPPICPDDPTRGKPSDHSVPVCTPHTDRYKPAHRNYQIRKYRPITETCMHKVGEWLV